MLNLFIPYAGDKPASLSINGHRLLILSTSKNNLEEGLSVLGGDRIKEIEILESAEAQQSAINSLARSVEGGVVIAPNDIDVAILIRNLEEELPWIQ